MNCDYLIETLNNPKLKKRKNKHLNRFAEDLGRALMTRYPGGQLFTEKKVQVTEGYSKKIDLGFISPQNITHYIELKSMGSSFGNNVNNRIEEATGQAYLLSKKSNFSYIFILSGDYKDSHYNKLKSVMEMLKDEKKILHNFALIGVGADSVLHDAEYSIKNLVEGL
tara:strand:+ start:60 stop:560 length:501 start_codon:yes stop_codon:yes gene_type:complete